MFSNPTSITMTKEMLSIHHNPIISKDTFFVSSGCYDTSSSSSRQTEDRIRYKVHDIHRGGKIDLCEYIALLVSFVCFGPSNRDFFIISIIFIVVFSFGLKCSCSDV